MEIPKKPQRANKKTPSRHSVCARHENPAFEEATDEVCGTNQALRQGMLDSRNHVHQLSHRACHLKGRTPEGISVLHNQPCCTEVPLNFVCFLICWIHEKVLSWSYVEKKNVRSPWWRQKDNIVHSQRLPARNCRRPNFKTVVLQGFFGFHT